MEQDSFIRFVGVNKIYPNGVRAVTDFNLDINRHEFIVLVGPSGCGKSTTLRMLAGLENITNGTLFINGDIANDLTPKDRDLAMVFQSYALYPHMSVYNNLAFGLKMRKHEEEVIDAEGVVQKALDTHKIKEIKRVLISLNKKRIRVIQEQEKIAKKGGSESDDFIALSEFLGDLDKVIASYNHQLEYYETTHQPLIKKRNFTKEEIDAKVAEAAKVLDIEKYLSSKPRELSGGQRQRVALGRAIVRNAKLFLMDEPLSNLDAKLRILMRTEIVALHQRLQSTTIYVTHDQTEAMTMADRIVIMKDGFIQQVGTPQEIYEQPNNRFTATFIGSPEMNIFDAKVGKKGLILGDSVTVSGQNVFETYRKFIDKTIAETPAGPSISEYKSLLENPLIPLYFGVRPEDIEVSKDFVDDSISASIKNIELLGKERYIHLDFNGKSVVAIIKNRDDLKINDVVYLTFPIDKRYYFDAIGERNIYVS